MPNKNDQTNIFCCSYAILVQYTGMINFITPLYINLQNSHAINTQMPPTNTTNINPAKEWVENDLPLSTNSHGPI